MIGHLLTLEVDFDPVPQLMDLHLFSDEPFGDGIAIGLKLDKTGFADGGQDDPIGTVGNRWKGLELFFL